MIEEAMLHARELAHENRLEGKDLDELDELEDEEDEEFLAIYKCVTYSTVLLILPSCLMQTCARTSLVMMLMAVVNQAKTTRRAFRTISEIGARPCISLAEARLLP